MEQPWHCRPWPRGETVWKESDEVKLKRAEVTSLHLKEPLAHDILCLEPWGGMFDFYDRAAAYLGFESVVGFLTWIDTECTKILEPYGQAPGEVQRVNYLWLVSVARHDSELQSALKSVEIGVLPMMGARLYSGGVDNSQLDSTGLALAACYTLLKYSSDGVKNGFAWFSPATSGTPQLMLYALEDWNRAFVAMRTHFDRRGRVDLSLTPLYQKPTAVPFLLPRDTIGLVPLATEIKINGEATTRLLEAMLGMSTSEERTPHFCWYVDRDEDSDMDVTRDNIIAAAVGAHMAGTNQTTNMMENVRRSAANGKAYRGEAIDRLTMEVMSQIASTLAGDNEVGGINTGGNDKKNTGPSGKSGNAISILAALAKEAQTTMRAMAGAHDALGPISMVQSTMTREAKAEEDRAKHIARIFHECNTATACPLAEAVAMAGLQLENPTLTGGFAFYPHQIVDAGTLTRLCQGPLRGALLSSESGMGKTATYLLALWNLQAEREKRYERGETVEFLPALVLVPSDTLGQVFDEIRAVSGKRLLVSVYHSAPENLLDPAETRLRCATIPPSRLASWCTDVMDRKSNPSTGRLILLASYSMMRRQMQWRTEIDETIPERVVTKGTATLSETLCNTRFSTLVADECQLMRRPRSFYGWLLRLLSAEHKLLVSATPVLNDMRDIRGLVTVLSEHAQLDYDIPRSFRALKRLFADDFDPYHENLIGYGRLFDPARRAQFPSLERVRKAWDVTRARYWLVQSKALLALGRHSNWNLKSVEHAVCKALRVMQVRRSFYTPMTLPDGTTTTPSASVPEFRVETIVVRHTNELGKLVQTLCDSMVRREGHTTTLGRSSAALAAFDASTTIVMQNHRRNSEEAILGTETARLVMNTGGYGAYGGHRRYGVAGVSGEGATLRLLHFETTREHELKLFGRADMAVYLMRSSPVLAKIVQLALDANVAGERLLVLVSDAWAQELVAQTLAELCLETESVRADHSPKERRQAVRRFNDPGSNVGVYVTSMHQPLFGLNLHGCCARGVIAQFGNSFLAFERCFARLVRLGQTKAVHWTILEQDASVNCVQEEYMHARWSERLLETLPLPAYLRRGPDYTIGAKVVVYEILRQHWGLPFNRFAWVIRPPLSVRDYSTPQTARLGRLLSNLALYLLGPRGESLAQRLEGHPRVLFTMTNSLIDMKSSIEGMCVSIRAMGG